MKKLVLLGLVLLLLSSCNEEIILPYPCEDGDCQAYFNIDKQIQPNTFFDDNGYHHIEYRGFKYFTFEGKLDKLHSQYEINGTPLVSTTYDSDTWIAFDTLSFRVPIYNVLGMTDIWQNPISVGNLEYTITDLARLHPPLNIAGYQINKATCWTCPYLSIGSSTNYSYYTRQQIYLNSRMIGDTIKIFIQTTFNTDLGPSVVQNGVFEIVIDLKK
jgi:hypothetical protein